MISKELLKARLEFHLISSLLEEELEDSSKELQEQYHLVWEKLNYIFLKDKNAQK